MKMNEKKTKIHFNFADALIVLVLFFLVSWMVTDAAFDHMPQTLLVGADETVFRLTDPSCAVLTQSGERLTKGAAVYNLESGERLGTLSADYSGEGTLTVFLSNEFAQKYLPGDTFDLKVEDFLFFDSVVTAVRREDAP